MEDFQSGEEVSIFTFF